MHHIISSYHEVPNARDQRSRSRTQSIDEFRSGEGKEKTGGRPPHKKGGDPNEPERRTIRKNKGGCRYAWWLLDFLNIGEAANSGLEQSRGMKMWSANVTSLNKRWPSMATWEPDITMVQETRLGREAQKIMAARIAQD